MAGEHAKHVQELPGCAGTSIALGAYSLVIGGSEGGLGDAMDEAP